RPLDGSARRAVHGRDGVRAPIWLSRRPFPDPAPGWQRPCLKGARRVTACPGRVSLGETGPLRALHDVTHEEVPPVETTARTRPERRRRAPAPPAPQRVPRGRPVAPSHTPSHTAKREEVSDEA